MLYFITSNTNKFAEMGRERKNELSMRRRAIEKLVKHLGGRGGQD